MPATFTLEPDPLGGGPILVNGDNVAPIVTAAQLTIAPGQPTTLDLRVQGHGRIEGEGIVHVATEQTAADAQAEVADLLRGLDGDTIWTQMMDDPTVDLSNPAQAFLNHVADLLLGVAT